MTMEVGFTRTLSGMFRTYRNVDEEFLTNLPPAIGNLQIG
jgi:hypothetical protein